MTAIEYRKLCKRIYRMYAKTLNMSYFDACECCDEVYFGRLTESEFMQSMDDMATDELSSC